MSLLKTIFLKRLIGRGNAARGHRYFAGGADRGRGRIRPPPIRFGSFGHGVGLQGSGLRGVRHALPAGRRGSPRHSSGITSVLG